MGGHAANHHCAQGVAAPYSRCLATPHASSFTILVIDDDSELLEFITELLAGAGHRTITASNGADGLMCASSEQPDLILVDYHMPAMNGLAVVERLKADLKSRRIPVVAMTSGTGEQANELSRAGCVGFIPKPFAPPEFIRLVEDILNETVGRSRRSEPRP